MDWLIENPKDGTLLALISEGEFLAGGPGRHERGGKPFPVRLPAASTASDERSRTLFPVQDWR